jgi:hypothetical protein
MQHDKKERDSVCGAGTLSKNQKMEQIIHSGVCITLHSDHGLLIGPDDHDTTFNIGTVTDSPGTGESRP